MHVLLIEPDRVSGQTIAAYLSPDHTVMLVSDVQAAIHVFDTQSVDVIVTEMVLAGHNGIEFLYELRSYEDLQHVPAILYTTVKLDERDTGLMMRKMGVMAVLDKTSTSLKQLKHTIDTAGVIRG